MPANAPIIETAMTEISLSGGLSDFLADQAKTNGHTTSDLTAQIELAVEEADQGNFATEEKVSVLRARRWNRNACWVTRNALKNPACSWR